MQQAIQDKLDKARDQINKVRARAKEEIEDRREQVAEEFTQRREAIKSELGEARESYRQLADQAKSRGQGALIGAEVSMLEATRDLLSWAAGQLGPRAEFVSRGEAALDEALVALRAGHSATLPLDGFDELTVKEVIARLEAEALDLSALRTLHAYEVRHKNRVTLLRDLDKRVEEATPADVE